MNSIDDFEFINLESIEEENKNQPCNYPYQHKFERKLLAQSYYFECSKCGYSPELDFNKENFRKCHEDYLCWKKTQR